MAAVPHFDMKPGERLKPLREVPVNVEHLLGKAERTARQRAARCAARGAQSVEDLHHAQIRLVRQGHATAVSAVDDVSFDIRRGECLGLVGESGCGKTTVSKIIMRALTPDTGAVRLQRRATARSTCWRPRATSCASCARKIQMVFQDPVSSLSPRMTVQNILTEPLEIHERGDAALAAGNGRSR